MAIKTVNELKGYFETGKKPTQQQFWDWLESFVHKSDGIAIANVAGLSSALNAKLDKVQFDAFEAGVLLPFNADGTYLIPGPSLLEKIIPFYGSPGTMKLSRVEAGGEDVAEEIDIQGGWNPPIQIDVVAIADTTLYITGIPAGSMILFLKRKIKVEI